MKAAGLTHGGFYGHFRSKNDLIAQTIGYVDDRQSKVADDLGAWFDAYLSQLHRDHADLGCPTAALAGFLRNQAPESRAAMAHVLAAQIDSLAAAMPGLDASEARRAAIGSWSAMVGALILARSVDDPKLSDELLAETRAWLGDKKPHHPLAPARKGRAA